MSLTAIQNDFAAELSRVTDYWLFHTCNAYKALHILRDNALKLPLSETNSTESKHAKKLFYLSFARTAASGYIADRSTGRRSINESVLFIFNAQTLLRRRGVIIAPVDYWGLDSKGRSLGNAREAEERLFSDTPVLPGIVSDIVEIRIATSFDKYENYSYLLDVVFAAKKHKIPVKLFLRSNKVGYLRGVENLADRALIMEQLKKEGFNKNKNSGYSEASRAKILKKKIPNWGTSSWLPLMTEFVYATSYAELSTKARDRLWYLLRDKSEFAKNSESEIHNLRAGNEVDKKRFYALLRKMKSKTVAQFFSDLYEKWSKIQPY